MTNKPVLLVEDEMFVALDLADIVETAGYQVDGPYMSVEETLRAVGGKPHACAILDVQLIDGEVYPAADRLHQAGVPIIFHSGHADAPALEHAYPGAVVCSKPCAPRTLRAALDRVLGQVTTG